MEPIVNPWFVYAISIVSSLKELFMCGFFVMLIVDFFGFLYLFIEVDKPMHKIYNKETKKLHPLFKITLALNIALPLLTILIPTKETLIAMYIANNITPDNLNMANEIFKTNLKDYVDIITSTLKK